MLTLVFMFDVSIREEGGAHSLRVPGRCVLPCFPDGRSVGTRVAKLAIEDPDTYMHARYLS